MDDSILNTIKKLIGIEPEYTAFDDDIIVAINTILPILSQLGVETCDGFYITGEMETWDNFLPDDNRLGMVKNYIASRVRMIFDTPTNSSVANAMDRTIAELEWRINVTVDPGGDI